MLVPRHSGVVVAGGIGAIVLLAACGTSRPPPPPLVLTPPSDTVNASFADAAGAAWLGGGRWALVSEGSGSVGIVDFSAHRLTLLGGAKGSQLQNPVAVFSF